MKNLLKILVAFSVIFSLYACESNQPETSLPTNIEHKLYNVKYGNADRNLMDVFLPANRTEQSPFVILIHGGAWIGGDKTLFTTLQSQLLTQGIGSVSINYRYVSSSVHYTQLMEDVGNAVKFCISQSDKWTIRKNKFIISGHSAGAHMALLYGYSYDSQNVIGGIIEVSGPTKFDEPTLEKAKSMFLLDPIQNLADAKYISGQPLPENFKTVSPYWNVKNIPTLIIHGTSDETVAFQQGEILHQMLDEKGYTNKFLALQNGNHALNNLTAEQNIQYMIEVFNWINSYGK